MDIVLFAIFFCLVPMYLGGAAFSESTPGALFAVIGTLILFMLGMGVCRPPRSGRLSEMPSGSCGLLVSLDDRQTGAT